MNHILITDRNYFDSIVFAPTEDKYRSINNIIAKTYELKVSLYGHAYIIVSDIANSPRNLEVAIRDYVENHRPEWIVLI